MNKVPKKTEPKIPPIIPDKSPEYNGAPDANAIPKHKGKATKKTDKPAGKSCLNQMSS